MPLPPLPDSAIMVGARARDWRDAVHLAGEALQRSGSTRAAYSDRMIEMIEEHGAYIVIAPGLALAHARPGPDVLADGLSIVTLDEPVVFGHPYNDPVTVIVGLATDTAESHLLSVAELANVFNDSDTIPALAAAADEDDVRRILGIE